MTVAEMHSRMGQDEFMRWGVYYARRNQDMEVRTG
nr:hypothetical protein Hi04_10k_c361_00012 [uncultured bacterium]